MESCSALWGAWNSAVRQINKNEYDNSESATDRYALIIDYLTPLFGADLPIADTRGVNGLAVTWWPASQWIRRCAIDDVDGQKKTRPLFSGRRGGRAEPDATRSMGISAASGSDWAVPTPMGAINGRQVGDCTATSGDLIR